MSGIRQRLPFKAPDEDEDEHRVLDEQEQEAVVEDIRKEYETFRGRWVFLERILIAACIALQLTHITDPFCVFSVLPLVNLLLVFNLPAPIIPLPIFSSYPFIAFVALIPLTLDLLIRSPGDISWMYRTAVLATISFSWQINRWGKQGEEELRALEGLKYQAPGA